MEPVSIIEKLSDFMALIDILSKVRHIAIDTESNSFYAYFERICLIQISTPDHDYIIDPLTLEDMQPFGAVLLDASIEKIFHASANDILGLKRDFGFKIENLFDTAVACKLLGYQQLGLAKILAEQFGVSLNKKWQRFNWGKRPLKQEQLDYARLDTHYLIPLRHRLAEELQARELLDLAKELSEKVGEQEVHKKTFMPESFIDIHGAQSLDAVGKNILKALYLYREHEARRRNCAPFRILPNETLVRLAHDRPSNVEDFCKIKGLPRTYHNSRAAHHLLALIRKTGTVQENKSKP